VKTFFDQQVHQVLGPGVHAKRIALLADATLGVMHAALLAVCTITVIEIRPPNRPYGKLRSLPPAQGRDRGHQTICSKSYAKA
jgi:hypothetical protein